MRIIDGNINILYALLKPLLALGIITATIFTKLDEFQDRILDPFRNQDDIFDFVIVGGGSTGSVLSNKLSKDFRVLLLEAGGFANVYTGVPISTFALHGSIEEDWKYETVPQKSAGFGLQENKLIWHAGKGLGGSSLINAMIYLRGNVQGFDKLAEKTGDLIWKVKNVLKYYKKIEDYRGYFKIGDHGIGGKLSIEAPQLSPFMDNLFRAMQEQDFKIRDPNSDGPVSDGGAPIDLHTKNGVRSSAYHAYVKPILQRPNLTIRKYSYVHKVVLNQDNVATGVQYFRHGKVQIARASKEVILSAGAIQTPKILMLSGIGPKSHLQELKIPVKIDLPVGDKLQDKFGAIIGPFIVNPGYSFLPRRDFNISNLIKWFLTGTGPFGSSRAEAVYSMTSKFAKNSSGHQQPIPDINTYVLSLPMDEKLEGIITKGLNIKPDIVKSYFKSVYGKEMFIQLVTNSRPAGFGTLRLRDSDPKSPVLIDPKYLENNRDLETLIEGIKFAVNLVEETKSFGEIGGHLLPQSFPGCEGHAFKSEAYWECLGRSTTATAFKYGGTAPLGKNISDPFAVVDSRLRVFGVKKLRVIDGSVLEENMVSVNHVTCLMLGELASDFIINEYTNKKHA